MGVISSFVLSSFSDGLVPHFREPVESVFDGVVEHKGLPNRQDFRELRNRIDMLDYQTREVTKSVNELRGRLDEVTRTVSEAEERLGRVSG